MAGVGVGVLVGGPLGVVLGVAVGVVARQVLRRFKSAPGLDREALSRQAPDAVDCLASCLAAGAPLWSAIRVVAAAFGEPLCGLWQRAADKHALGSPPPETFSEWLDDPLLAPVGRLLVRSSESGGSLGTSLLAAAEQMRQERAEELDLRARAVGVKAVAPLGVCFLPAFILLAVVPIVGSLVQGLLRG
jgi:pilus assembly protein TadC